MTSFKKKLCFGLLLIMLVVCFAGCCDHTWVSTDCESPNICSECGATSDPNGHQWQGSGCVEPMYCEVCNMTVGEGLGHTTKYGKCSRCGHTVDELDYKDGYAIITYADTTWMQEQSDFIDVYVVGTIVAIDKTNRVTIVDREGEQWTIGVGTACDLSPYMGTECEAYGFTNGKISSQYDTPLINMDHDDNHIVLSDGKTLYPQNFESTQQFDDKYADNFNNGGSGKVWIPANGGSKYHSKATCSGMKNPEQVTENEAIERGFKKCGKCW